MLAPGWLYEVRDVPDFSKDGHTMLELVAVVRIAQPSGMTEAKAGASEERDPVERVNGLRHAARLGPAVGQEPDSSGFPCKQRSSICQLLQR